ncbi:MULTISPECIES: pPIWI_RE module domain-containing protein [unclassified Streptomyces]|uniref:pPIWI_RE module domain-containing protein n=1 Tax=unclassified Streptomyces TaxID=2593676 RepID=UPI001660AF20|nr:MULTISPECIES: DUF3962 domain-containing protein [unclassified Streptomyces]MBD0711622.1 hypothetical protein [Streptomyces sp. CBMA291]MBD0714819.1 hypothetical protein [Streptomyces sp. CBMA370]
MYRVIRTAAYEPDPAHGPWTEPLHVVRLEDELHKELLKVYDRTRNGEGPSRSLPLRRLDALLRAMAPGVLATARGAGGDGTMPWLYAREPVPREVVAPLVATWAAGMLRAHDDENEGDDLVPDTALDDLDRALGKLPRWERESVDLTETTTSLGGTAEPARRLFRLLPERIAFHLAQRPFRARGTELAFRVVTADHGTELVSWPPRQYVSKGKTWYYSALLTVTVQTVPFMARFRVHVSYGIRRWTTRFPAPSRGARGATVLLDSPLPWPDGPDRGHRLVTNAVGFDWRRGRLAWRGHSPALLISDLDIVHRYPEPAELCAKPEKWLAGAGGIMAGVVHSSAHGAHGVGPGLMPQERAELDEWVEEGLAPMFRRVPDLTRVTRRNIPALLSRQTTTEAPARETAATTARRGVLTGALSGGPLDVEVLWQSEETREALHTALSDVLGMPPGDRTGGPEDERWHWRGNGIDLRVRARSAGELVSSLEVSGDRRRRRAARLAEAVERRSALVADHLASPDGARGAAIIEIAGKDRFPDPDTDPKHALRIACARQERVSQFVNLPEDSAASLPHRARWAWLDTLRQLGAIEPPAHRAGDGIPADLQYAALWLVRHTRRGPTRSPARRLIAVRVRSDGGRSTVEGWNAERAAWVPYPDLLLSLVSEAALTEPATVEQHIRSVLFQLRDRPTLLLADVGNLRQGWPGLKHGNLARDRLSFGEGTAQRLALYGPDLRIVLTRDANGRDEVPEWYAHDGAGKAGFSQGVWGQDEPDRRVFVSTAEVPHTATLPKGLRKIVPSTAAGRTAPGKTAWNPAHLELTVLGCLTESALAGAGRPDVPADRPEEWATLAHQLRFHDDYPPLSRPLPLHLARLAGEYVLPLDTSTP